MASPTHCIFPNKAAANRAAASYRKQFGLGIDGKPRRYGRPRSMFKTPVCKCGHVIGSHGHDTPWHRCGHTACLHEHCDCQKFEVANAPAQRPLTKDV